MDRHGEVGVLFSWMMRLVEGGKGRRVWRGRESSSSESEEDESSEASGVQHQLHGNCALLIILCD